jgi:hypothetical protein
VNNYEDTYEKYLTEHDRFVHSDGASKKSTFLKQDCELFDEKKYTPAPCIRVKRVNVSKTTEDWKIFVNDQELLLKGYRFSTPERRFLRTPEGITFIINGAKKGWTSVSEFKRNLKDIVKEGEPE